MKEVVSFLKTRRSTTAKKMLEPLSKEVLAQKVYPFSGAFEEKFVFEVFLG